MILLMWKIVIKKAGNWLGFGAQNFFNVFLVFVIDVCLRLIILIEIVVAFKLKKGLLLWYGNIIGEKKTRKNKVAIQVEIDTIFGGKCVFMNFGIFKVNVPLPHCKSYGYFQSLFINGPWVFHRIFINYTKINSGD